MTIQELSEEMRKRIKYVVERKNGTKEFYKTKKEICETYGIDLACVNNALGK